MGVSMVAGASGCEEPALLISPRIQRIFIRFTKGSPGERQASMVDGGKAVLSSMGFWWETGAVRVEERRRDVDE